MNDQGEEPDFLTTIKELMRLTRKGVLDWSVDHSITFETFRNPNSPERLPTYKAEYDNLVFIIEDAALHPFAKAFSPLKKGHRKDLRPGSKYRLKIEDKEDSSTISSPPIKAIRDLVSVIEKKPKDKKLNDINNKLSKIG